MESGLRAAQSQHAGRLRTEALSLTKQKGADARQNPSLLRPLPEGWEAGHHSPLMSESTLNLMP
jgi:hypothetical protein